MTGSADHERVARLRLPARRHGDPGQLVGGDRRAVAGPRRARPAHATTAAARAAPRGRPAGRRRRPAPIPPAARAPAPRRARAGPAWRRRPAVAGRGSTRPCFVSWSWRPEVSVTARTRANHPASPDAAAYLRSRSRGPGTICPGADAGPSARLDGVSGALTSDERPDEDADAESRAGRPRRRLVQQRPALAGGSRRHDLAARRRPAARRGPRRDPHAARAPAPSAGPPHGQHRAPPGRRPRWLGPARAPAGRIGVDGRRCPAGCASPPSASGPPTSSSARSSPPARACSPTSWSTSSSAAATRCRPSGSPSCARSSRRTWAVRCRASSPPSTASRWPRRRSPRSTRPRCAPARTSW